MRTVILSIAKDLLYSFALTNSRCLTGLGMTDGLFEQPIEPTFYRSRAGLAIIPVISRVAVLGENQHARVWRRVRELYAGAGCC